MNIFCFCIGVLLFTFFYSNSLEKPGGPPDEHVRSKILAYRVINNELSIRYAIFENAWYHDSMGITQLCSLETFYDTNHVFVRFSNETIGYRFIDLRKKWVYEYRDLSDTATITSKFLRDTAHFVGGYNFYDRTYIQFDSLRVMPDTVISGITYLKRRYRQFFKGKYSTNEALFRCDKKESAFQFDLGLHKVTGCPMVKGTTLTKDEKFPTGSSEIEFVEDGIPDSVRRVFTAWKRNVILSPVQ